MPNLLFNNKYNGRKNEISMIIKKLFILNSRISIITKQICL